MKFNSILSWWPSASNWAYYVEVRGFRSVASYALSVIVAVVIFYVFLIYLSLSPDDGSLTGRSYRVAAPYLFFVGPVAMIIAQLIDVGNVISKRSAQENSQYSGSTKANNLDS